MALLLYLGEYTHARHLWRRHRRAPPSSSENNSDNSNNGNANSSDYAQLDLLWNVSKHCYLWSTGGIYSLTSSNGISASSDGMQVETNDESTTSDDSGNLPFSTLALRALQSCQSSELEPLSTYSAELLGVFRSRVNRQLHKSFDKLDCHEFCLRMNLESYEGVEQEFGWEKEGEYLVSDVDVVLDDEEEDAEGMKEENRIEKLTDIVMFLEGKVNA